jgi:peptidyl-prolyl cis-trans isomerase A (cyclophilin A)
MIRLFIAILVFLSVDICNAEVVVRLSMQQGTTKNTVDLKLLDGDAPLTVANFLNYADNGDYDNSFIHRSVPGFIMQVGGFTYNPLDGAFINDPALNDFPGGLQPVPAGPAVVNEFRGSNLSGTIAMAKLPSDPDSATNEWFFNLADN